MIAGLPVRRFRRRHRGRNVASAIVAGAPVIAAVSSDKGSSTSAGLTVTFGTDGPSGIAAGDLLVFFVSASGENTNDLVFNTPAGWTIAEDEIDTAGDRAGGVVFYKISDGTEVSVVATLSSGGSVSRGLTGKVARITGANATPILITAVTTVDTTSPVALNGVDTTGTNNCLVLYFLACRNADAVTFAFDTGTEQWDFSTDPGTSNVQALASLVQVTGGATGTITATPTGTLSAFAAVGMTIAIKP